MQTGLRLRRETWARRPAYARTDLLAEVEGISQLIQEVQNGLCGPHSRCAHNARCLKAPKRQSPKVAKRSLLLMEHGCLVLAVRLSSPTSTSPLTKKRLRSHVAQQNLQRSQGKFHLAWQKYIICRMLFFRADQETAIL